MNIVDTTRRLLILVAIFTLSILFVGLVTAEDGDIRISQTTPTTTPIESENITITVNAFYSGTTALTDVLVQDLLPSGFNYMTATVSTGSVSNRLIGSPQKVLLDWRIPTLNPMMTETLTIIAQAQLGTGSYTGVFTNAAAIQVPDYITDTVLSNNLTELAIDPQPLPGEVDIAVYKSVDDTTPVYGQDVVFTVVVINEGDDVATGVVVYDFLPDGVTVCSGAQASCSSNVYGSYSIQTGVWFLPNRVEPNVPYTLTLQTEVTAMTGTITNTAYVADVGQLDLDNSNDSSSVAITPRLGQVEVGVTTTANITNVAVSDIVTHTIELYNDGPDDAFDVVVSVPIPFGLSLLPGGTINGGTAQYSTADKTAYWGLDVLPAGSVFTWTLLTEVLSVTVGTNIETTAGIETVKGSDTIVNNNSDSVDLLVQSSVPSAVNLSEVNSEIEVALAHTLLYVGILALPTLAIFVYRNRLKNNDF